MGYPNIVRLIGSWSPELWQSFRLYRRKQEKRFLEMELTTQTVVRSIKWTTFETIFVALTGIIAQFGKALFLSPEEFGYLAIILIVEGFIRLFENKGISQAIKTKSDVTNNDVAALNIFNIALSLLLALFLFLIAPSIASYYSMPKLDFYLRFITLSLIMSGPAHIFRALLEKEMLFKELSIISMVRNFASVILTFSLLVAGYGLTGVVFAIVLTTFINTLLILFVSIRKQLFRPKIFFSLANIRPFIRFGVSVFGLQIFNYVLQRADEMLIGYFLSPEILGLYSFGKGLIKKIKDTMQSSFSKVLLPVFSKGKNNFEKLSRQYLTLTKSTSLFLFPVFAGIAITSGIFVPYFFGGQWEESIIVFRTLSLVYVFWVLTGNLATSLLISIGKHNLLLSLEVVLGFVYIFNLVIFARYGLIAVLCIHSLYIMARFFVLQFSVSKSLEHSFLSYFFTIKKIVGATMIMGIITSLLIYFIPHSIHDFFKLAMVSIGGAITYFLLIVLLERKLVLNLGVIITNGRFTPKLVDEKV